MSKLEKMEALLKGAPSSPFMLVDDGEVMAAITDAALPESGWLHAPCSHSQTEEAHPLNSKWIRFEWMGRWCIAARWEGSHLTEDNGWMLLVFPVGVTELVAAQHFAELIASRMSSVRFGTGTHTPQAK